MRERARERKSDRGLEEAVPSGVEVPRVANRLCAVNHALKIHRGNTHVLTSSGKKIKMFYLIG